MSKLRFAMMGAGFWSRFQLAGWRELDDVACVAICDPVRDRAAALAKEFGIPTIATNAKELLKKGAFDFVDIVASVNSHESLAMQALAEHLPVVCQKPLMPDLATAERAAGLPLLVHENWRWQPQFRAFADLLRSGVIGRPFRARVSMLTGFSVFDNQPALRTLERFLLNDLGTHTLDLCRFLFGEFRRAYCQTQRVHEDIAGEDVVTALLEANSGASVLLEMAYAETPLERDGFPQTTLFVEGTCGSLELYHDYEIRLTTGNGTESRRVGIPLYPWTDPQYAVVHASIVPCLQNLITSLQGRGAAETTAADNLLTLRLVDACYRSAAVGEAVTLR